MESCSSTDQVVYLPLLRYIVHLDNNDIFINNHFRRNSKVILDQDIIENDHSKPNRGQQQKYLLY